MTGVSDEILMSYVDGQLDPVERKRVERLLEADPGLQERLRIFEEAGRGISRLFESHLRAPIPIRLRPFALPASEKEDLIVAKKLKTAAFSMRLKEFLGLELSPVSLALACGGVALIVGAGLGVSLLGGAYKTERNLGNLVQIDQGQPVARGPLRQLLETSPSGNSIPTAEGQKDKLQLKVRLTFKNKRDEYCREYEIRREGGEGYAGLACREAGDWRIEMQASMGLQGNSGVAAPAGIDRAHQAVEAAVLASINGDSLGREEETAALRSVWGAR